jgi:hypothetical protein
MSGSTGEQAIVMTLRQMQSEFESEWILVGDPVLDELQEVVQGKVLCHSKDRDEVYREAINLRPAHSAIVYTGEMPPDTAIVL